MGFFTKTTKKATETDKKKKKESGVITPHGSTYIENLLYGYNSNGRKSESTRGNTHSNNNQQSNKNDSVYPHGSTYIENLLYGYNSNDRRKTQQGSSYKPDPRFNVIETDPNYKPYSYTVKANDNPTGIQSKTNYFKTNDGLDHSVVEQDPNYEKKKRTIIGKSGAYYGRGNIDLNARTPIKNDDGTFSTESSFSTNINGKEYLLPTIINGKRVSEEEAIKHFEETGEYLGRFDSIAEANKYAEELHKRQAEYYDPNSKKLTNEDKLLLLDSKKNPLTQTPRDKLDGLLRPLTQAEQSKYQADRDKEITSGLLYQMHTPQSGWDNVRGYSNDYFAQQKYGISGGTGRLSGMSETQLRMEREQNEKDIALAQEKEKHFKENEEQLKQTARDAEELQGKYANLEIFGVPVNGADGTDTTQGSHLKERPEDYWDGTNRYDYDELLYDYLNGQGAYMQRLEALQTDEETDALFAEMDDLWESIENGTIETKYAEAMEAYAEANRNTVGDYGSGRLQERNTAIDEELKRRAEIERLTGEAPEGTGKYDPNAVIWGLNGSQIDQIYYYANRGLNNKGQSDFEKYGTMRPESFMSAEQLEVFNRYYLAGQKEEAKAFYDALMPYLQEIQAYYKTNLTKKMSQNEYAPLMIWNRITTQPMAGITGTVGTVLALAGNKEAQNPYSPYYDMTRTNQTIQSARAEEWGKQLSAWFPNWANAEEAGQFLNNVFYSIVDNIVSMELAGGGAGFKAGGSAEKFAEHMIQFIMSSEATASTMLERLDAGYNPTEAALFALGSGGIEAITEKYSIEALLKPDVKELLGKPKELAKYLLKNTVAEGSEEVASDVMGTMLDTVLSYAFDHKTELMQQYDAYLAAHPEATESDALKAVLLDYAGQLGTDFLAGGLSGLLMSGARAGETRVKLAYEDVMLGNKAIRNGTDANTLAQDREDALRELDEGMKAAQEIKDEKEREAKLKELGEQKALLESKTNKQQASTKEAENKIKLMEAGLKMDPKSESYRIASEIKDGMTNSKDDLDHMKKASNRDYGRLVRSIINESNEQIGQIAKGVLESDIVQQLQDAGETKKRAQMFGRVLAEAVVTNNMTAESWLTMQMSEKAQEIWKSFKDSDAVKQAKALASEINEVQKSVMQLIMDPRENGISEADAEASMQGAEAASAEDIAEADANGKRSGNANEVIADGKYADITGIERKVVEEKNEKGKTVKQSRVYVTLNDGRSVDIALVKGMNQQQAQVLQFMKNDQGKTIGTNLANALLQTAGTAKNTARTVSDAMKILWDMQTGMTTAKTNLDTNTEDTIRKAIQADMDAWDAERANNNKKIRPGQGRTTINGAEFGTKEFQQQISKLDKEIRDEANFIGQIAKSAGFEVELYYDPKTAGNQGSFMGGKDGYGIRINLAGTVNIQGAHRSAVATFAHETTHWLEANSPEAYKALRNFVLQNVRKSGMSLQGELRRIMDNYAAHGEEIDLNGAIAEMVAMGSEQVLTNEKVATQLRQQDAKTYGKVQEAVNWIVNQIRKVIGSTRDTSSRYAKALMNVNNELARIWLGAYQEALGAKGTGTGTQAQASLRVDENNNTAYDYTNSFEQQVEDVINGVHPTDEPVFIGEIPNVLKGIGLTKLPLVIAKGHVRDMLGLTNKSKVDLNHRFNKEFVINLPETIAHPVAIIESRSNDQKKRDNSIVMILDQYNPNTNHHVIGAVEIQKQFELNGETYDGYMINSIHGRDNAINMLINAMNTEDSDNHGVFYLNKNKANVLCKDPNVNAAKAGRIKTFAKHGFIHNINDTGSAVKTVPMKQTETAQFKRWFKDSWIKNEDGSPKIMYHGTLHGGFDTFGGRNNFWYFADTKDYAKTFAGRNKNNTFHKGIRDGVYSGVYKPQIYEAYLSVQNPFITDDQDIVEFALYQDRSLVDMLKEKGYDALMLKDMSQVIVLNRNQIKSATDNIGTFDRGIDNIKYSIRDDNEYMAAVKNKDMAAAQEYVSRVAQSKGFTEKVYHGTPTGGFTVFHDWCYFTKNKAYADRYNHASASSTRGRYETTTPMTYELYMNPGKVFDTRNPKARRLYNEARMEYGLNGLDGMKRGLPDWTDGRDLIEFIEDRGLDYDTILLDEGADGGYGQEVVDRGISYVTRANRVKSTNTVTYDSQNNIIKPSDRFNIDNNDIQFSMREPVEVNKAGLVAVHNLTSRNLYDTLVEGGFTAPSIAIVRAAMGHSKYGEISAVFKPSAIDPKQSRRNKVYGMDAWTPTRSNAQIETKLNYEVLQNARDIIRDTLQGTEWQNEALNWINRWLYEDQTTDTMDDMIDRAYRNDGMIAAYYAAKGRTFERKTKFEKIHSELHEQNINQYNAFLNHLEELGMLQEFMDDMNNETGFTILEKYTDIFGDSSEENKKYADAYKNKPDSRLNKNILFNKMKQARWFQQDGRQILTDEVYDRIGTIEAAREKISKKDFGNWIEGLIGGSLGERGVYNGTDLFTRSGNRRSFGATHDEPTAENIVRAMYANHEAKGGEAGGATGLMAKASKEYNNLDEIRADAGRLQIMEEEEYKAMINALDDKLNSLAERISQISQWDYYTVKATLIEAGEAYAKQKTAAAIGRYMQQQGIKLTEAQINEAKQLMEEAQNIPTGYFEAKPETVKEFEELAKIIMPEDAELESMLAERSIPYEIYDGTEEDRLRILNEQTDAQFSIMDETDIDARAWMETVQESSLQTEAEKQLLRDFKALRMKISLRQESERKYQREIAQIEAKPEAQRTKEDNYKLQGLKVRLENSQKIKEQAQEELAKITSSNGYVSMMYRQQRIMNDFMYGRTQEEVRSAVERLEKSAANIERTLQENEKKAAELEKSGIVQQFKKLLGTTTVDQTLAQLKKQYNSTWTKNQLKPYLEPIILKMKAGEDFSQDVETLAGILVNSDSTNTYEELSALRGLVITMGKGAQQELKAQHSSLKEVRARLAGTGIQVKYGERSTLESDIDDLRAEYPSIPDLGDEKDALGNFLDWIDGMKSQSASNEFYDQKLAEAMAIVTQSAAGAAKGIYMPTDAKAQQQVLAMMDFVKGLSAENQKALETLQSVADELGKLRSAGQQATGMVNTLAHDTNTAIDYFNTMAKIAQDRQKAKTKKDLIEQLKSENAQKIAKNNEEWRQLIERDKNARAQAEKNMSLRGQINTVTTRMFNKLKNPKGMVNVPEHMQGLARQVLGWIINNDQSEGRHKLTQMSRKQLEEAQRILTAWTNRDGAPDLSGINQMSADNFAAMVISQDLTNLKDGLEDWNREYKGKNKLDTLERRGIILQHIQEAMSEIYGYIRAENEVFMAGKKKQTIDAAADVMRGASGRKYREWTGKAGRGLAAMHKAIVSGNMTPEYFFRTLGNEGLNALWENYHQAENRNGLELAKAKARLDEIAKKYGYETWDPKKRTTVHLESGDVNMTLGQMMALWATWNREKQLGPEMSEHLTKGGFYTEEQDLREGILGKTTIDKRAHRISATDKESGINPDMQQIESLLTAEQKAYVNDVVSFMSNEMSELGNEASMAAYGIRMYKEKYYFPFQMWDGIKSRKSNESGSAANNDRAFHPSFSKSRLHGANNAIVIGDFTQTAADHIAGMINYATMGLANESLQKVLNQQMQDGGEMDQTKRNIRTILEETYGKEAMEYLTELQVQLNGGAVKTRKSLGDKAISLFRKNAVAGSLSVALQQPLSYIRAAMMVNPKYLARAISPDMWKGSYKEMLEHSGVAVIKDMGRFDMNFGQSAREFLMPDAMEKTTQKIWHGIEEYSTKLPELMDRMTWTRMWSACKAEQKALHPEMDPKSDEFLDLCGVRFNEIMRRTQVYDSVLVKSANMRDDNYFVKSLTSFMAEPTLTLNVLADATRQALQGEKGGKAAFAKAGATFMLSALAQAAIKGLMSSGRSPDDKKTWEENFLYRFFNSFLTEADPLQLIPGFSDLITLLKDGKLNDDAMGALGKFKTASEDLVNILIGNKELSHRSIEDSAAQLMQLMTGVPLKNIMRDGRAMWNWFGAKPYADRETSWSVIKNQTIDSAIAADNFVGVIMKYLGDAGYKTSNTAYYQRIYDAKKAGNQQQAQGMIDYLLNGKGVTQDALSKGLAAAAKKDDGESAADTAGFLISEGLAADDYIRKQYKEGKMTDAEAMKMLREANPKMTENDAWWAVDRMKYQKETGAKDAPSGTYYRLKDAINENRSDAIKAAVKQLLDHGGEKDKIKSWIGSKSTGFKTAYLEASGSEKVRIKNALIMAYKAVGVSEKDANAIINKWEKDAKKNK